MTTLYRLVLIESAEQAEALPEGTVAFQSWGHGTTARTLTGGRWITPSGAAPPHAEAVGMQALVSIEAEEEWTVGTVAPAWSPGTESWAREFQAQVPGRRLFKRLVTPWELE